MGVGGDAVSDLRNEGRRKKAVSGKPRWSRQCSPVQSSPMLSDFWRTELHDTLAEGCCDHLLRRWSDLRKFRDNETRDCWTADQHMVCPSSTSPDRLSWVTGTWHWQRALLPQSALTWTPSRVWQTFMFPTRLLLSGKPSTHFTLF